MTHSFDPGFEIKSVFSTSAHNALLCDLSLRLKKRFHNLISGKKKVMKKYFHVYES